MIGEGFTSVTVKVMAEMLHEPDYSQGLADGSDVAGQDSSNYPSH